MRVALREKKTGRLGQRAMGGRGGALCLAGFKCEWSFVPTELLADLGFGLGLGWGIVCRCFHGAVFPLLCPFAVTSQH